MLNNLTEEKNWLIGAGYMAQEYAKVLKDQKKKFLVIGRSKNSAEVFEEKLNMPVFIGGVDKAIKLAKKPPEYAIVAVNINQLFSVCMDLLDFGVKNILVEKPAGLNRFEINEIYKKSIDKNSKIFVAYNRRFFSSTIKAQEIIEKDGGVASFNFEFTEWEHRIRASKKPKEVFENWFLANSTHVVDLAFFLGGLPIKMSSFVSGETDWYKKASVFSGAGVSNKNALFSYQANWKGPGRWSVEIITPKHRLIFRPMEKLQIQEIGSINTEFVEIEDCLDNKYKPGLYLQTKAFVDGEYNSLLNIGDHFKITEIYSCIEDGGSMD